MINKFTTAAMTNVKTHNIMRVGTSSSRRSLAINHEMFQARWVIHIALANNTSERMTQRGIRISCPYPSLTKQKTIGCFGTIYCLATFLQIH